ncbi:PaaI family thioesterase [Jongsikchunia kroppenstedtii]|uniref:PaaI family thioesterase n=1 Tax=Jongsikchunia kroppenstedtii TaxID=1121721 RepID=UPI000475DDF1|nr:PaaI family thioesterase [Jongsikchunia kroppenstedtii]
MPAPIRLPPHSPVCMGCGPQNSSGLQLEVYRDADHVYADHSFTEKHAGGPGLAHGGAISAACDDIMGFTLWIAGAPAVTRTLTVKYRRPVPLHVPVRLTAWIDESTDQILHIGATGTVEGETYFSATGEFVKVGLAHFQRYADPSIVDSFFLSFLRRK